MKTQHTPGITWTKDGWGFRDKDGVLLANFYSQDFMKQAIAAPELYAALKELLGLWEETDGSKFQSVEFVDTLLARIEGGE